MSLIVPNFIALGQTMYEKSVTKYFAPFSIMAPHGDLLDRSPPVYALMYTARADLPMCQISSRSDNLSRKQLLPNFVDLIETVIDRTIASVKN